MLICMRLNRSSGLWASHEIRQADDEPFPGVIAKEKDTGGPAPESLEASPEAFPEALLEIGYASRC